MSHGPELFSDVFARRDNCLSRLDARVKLVVALGSLLCVIFSTKLLLPVCILVACIAATISIGIPARLIALRLAAPLMLTAVLAVLQTLLNHALLARTLPMAARVIAAVSVVLLLSSVTPAHRIFHAMRALGMPRGWVEVALLMYRYIFTFFDLVLDMVAAQKLRMGYSSFRRGLSSLSTVAGMVIVRSVDQAERTHDAMVLRGFRGDIPLGEMRRLYGRDWLQMALSAVALAATFWLFEVRGR
jgi:cobalt/nickel transport system permease protein